MATITYTSGAIDNVFEEDETYNPIINMLSLWIGTVQPYSEVDLISRTYRYEFEETNSNGDKVTKTSDPIDFIIEYNKVTLPPFDETLLPPGYASEELTAIYSGLSLDFIDYNLSSSDIPKPDDLFPADGTIFSSLSEAQEQINQAQESFTDAVRSYAEGISLSVNSVVLNSPSTSIALDGLGLTFNVDMDQFFQLTNIGPPYAGYYHNMVMQLDASFDLETFEDSFTSISSTASEDDALTVVLGSRPDWSTIDYEFQEFSFGGGMDILVALVGGRDLAADMGDGTDVVVLDVADQSEFSAALTGTEVVVVSDIINSSNISFDSTISGFSPVVDVAENVIGAGEKVEFNFTGAEVRFFGSEAREEVNGTDKHDLLVGSGKPFGDYASEADILARLGVLENDPTFDRESERDLFALNLLVDSRARNGDGDILRGRNGNDFLVGSPGDDHLLGGVGEDILWGLAGEDILEGGSEKDQILGGDDADYVNGGDGLDDLLGGEGDDTLSGGDNLVEIDSESNSIDVSSKALKTIDDMDIDTMTGGSGNDFFIAGNQDKITDWEVGEEIELLGTKSGVTDYFAYKSGGNLFIGVFKDTFIPDTIAEITNNVDPSQVSVSLVQQENAVFTRLSDNSSAGQIASNVTIDEVAGKLKADIQNFRTRTLLENPLETAVKDAGGALADHLFEQIVTNPKVLKFFPGFGTILGLQELVQTIILDAMGYYELRDAPVDRATDYASALSSIFGVGIVFQVGAFALTKYAEAVIDSAAVVLNGITVVLPEAVDENGNVDADPGKGFIILKPDGQSASISGELKDLDGDEITNFRSDDKIVAKNSNFGTSSLKVTNGSAILDIDEDLDGVTDATITLLGNFEGAEFKVRNVGNNTEITLSGALPTGAPVAADDTADTDEDNAVTFNILDNDTDPDGDPILLNQVFDTDGSLIPFDVETALVNGGKITISRDGTTVFDPDGDFEALGLNPAPEPPAATFDLVYNVVESTDEGLVSENATLTINVRGLNDAPVADDFDVEASEDESVVLPILEMVSDVEGDELDLVFLIDPEIGEISFDGEDYRFIPAPDVNGDFDIQYTVTDENGGSSGGTLSLTIEPQNDDPVAVDDSATTDQNTFVAIDFLANDRDPDGDGLTVTSVGPASNGVTSLAGYEPDPGFLGTDSFTYMISDGNGGTATATATVTVTDTTEVADYSQSSGSTYTRLDRGWSTALENKVLGWIPLTQGIAANTVPHDDLVNIKDIIGSDFTDLIVGNKGNNIIRAGDGNDFFSGFGGDDTLFGEEGDDRVFGHLGNDTLDGGEGNDQLTGGEGLDIFVYTGGHDDILDFDPHLGDDDSGSDGDLVSISIAGIDDFDDLLATASQEGADTVFNISDADRLTLQNTLLVTLEVDDFKFV